MSGFEPKSEWTTRKRTVVAASNAELSNSHYFLRLWLAIRNMGISRRNWLNVIAEVIYDFISGGGIILNSDGSEWTVPDIDDVMGDPRWISILLEDIDGKPKRTGIRKLKALQLFDLFFRIDKPKIARHFGR